MYDTLGEGEFGFVYRGSLRQLNGNSVTKKIKFIPLKIEIMFTHSIDSCGNQNSA